MTRIVNRVSLPWAQPVFAVQTHPPRMEKSVTAVAKESVRGRPMIDAKDRAPYVHRDMIALAIALDLLTTHAKALHQDPTVLTDLVHAALLVGQTSGIDEAALVKVAASDQGDARAQLLQHVGASHPASVVDAAHRIADAAQLLIREVKIQMAAKDRVADKQA